MERQKRSVRNQINVKEPKEKRDEQAGRQEEA